MDDYISRQAAKEVLNKVCGITCPTNHRNQRGLICGACVLGRAINMIDELSPADAQPVRHGHWEDGHRSKYDGTRYWFRQCSECLYERNDDDSEKDTKYCPNCGALMDERR